MASHVPVIVLFIPVPLPHNLGVFVWDQGPWLVTYLMDEVLYPPIACLLMQMAVNREAAKWARLGYEPDPTPTAIRLAS